MTQTFEILNFGHCDLFEIWDLLFGIYIIPNDDKIVLRPKQCKDALDKSNLIDNQRIFRIPLIA